MAPGVCCKWHELLVMTSQRGYIPPLSVAMAAPLTIALNTTPHVYSEAAVIANSRGNGGADSLTLVLCCLPQLV